MKSLRSFTVAWFPCASLIGLAILLSGCITRAPSDWVIGAPYHPSNTYTNPLPVGFRRVAVLPLTAAGTELADALPVLETVVAEEFGKSKRFEILRISPDELQGWVGSKQVDSTRVLPRALLTRAKEELMCDGLLFSQVTQFHAYPPLAIGWSLKLVDVRSGAILWAADEVFDASQQSVVNGARLFRLRNSQLSSSLEDSKFILLQPNTFGHYSAAALIALLPPDYPKVQPQLADK
jgi:hypothetical protein